MVMMKMIQACLLPVSASWLLRALHLISTACSNFCAGVWKDLSCNTLTVSTTPLLSVLTTISELNRFNLLYWSVLSCDEEVVYMCSSFGRQKISIKLKLLFLNSYIDSTCCKIFSHLLSSTLYCLSCLYPIFLSDWLRGNKHLAFFF